MKKILYVTVIIALLCSLSVAQNKTGKNINVVGEVVELQCYISGLTGAGKGAVHKECALKSAKQGIPLGILEDKTGNLYLVGQTKKTMSGANEVLIPFVAEKVKVSGRIFEKGGMKLLLVSKIEKFEDVKKK